MRWIHAMLTKSAPVRLEEGRQGERTAIRASLVALRGSSTLRADLVDVGPRGLRLLTQQPLTVGEHLELRAFGESRCPGRRVVSCQVVWCRPSPTGYEVGLDCQRELAQTWIGFRLGLARAPKKRAQRRFAVVAGVTLSSGSANVESSLLDIGMGGAQVRTGLTVEAGQMIQLRIATRRGAVSLVATVVGVTVVSEDRQHVNLRFLRGQAASRQALSRRILELGAVAA